jgi:HAE1 family hydrophobic/amphiphilic exporter-1
MGLAEYSLKKPVTTIMIFLGVMLIGCISLSKLPTELFPPITYPQLTVFTSYANAAPEEVEQLLTRPIEEAMGTVSGIKAIRSISREGTSLVMGEFDWDQNMDFASLRSREKVDLIKARLPRDASEPLVVPYNPFELPVLTISVTGNRTPAQLRRIAVDLIKEELEKVSGVASASIEGGLEREILVEVNQDKLKAHGVAILEVSDAITNSNLNYPAGTIKESFYEYLIRTLGEFKSVKEIEDVVVKSKGEDERRNMSYDDELGKREIARRSNLVMVKDVASVQDTFKERSSFSRLNGKDNVSVSIQKQAQANTMQVVNNIKTAMPRLKQILPKDIRLEVVYDQSVFIREAIDGVVHAGMEGGVLAFLVIYLFLRSLRASVIITLSVPISIMVVFTLMYFGGVSLNIMSLGGLALGVGRVVDDAVVVLENIFQHRARGETPYNAALNGTEEVATAVIASTLTTVSVFIPMIFVVGVAGQLFKQLAFTVTFALLASLWGALTIVPLLSVEKKKPVSPGKEGEENKEPDFSGGKGWLNIVKKFDTSLRLFLKHRKAGLLTVLGIFIGSLVIVIFLEKELMPKSDQGQFIIKLNMPVGTKVTETNKLAIKLEDNLMKYPYVETVSSIVGSTKGESTKDIMNRLGSHQCQIMVSLKEKRKKKTHDVVQELKVAIGKDHSYKDAKVEFVLGQDVIVGAFGSGGGKPITIEIKGDKLDAMESIARRIEEKLKKIPGTTGVEDDIPEPSPEVKIIVDKDKSSLYNISVVDLARAAQMVLRGYVSSQFKEKGHETDIRVRLREKDRDTFDKLYRIQINSPTSGMIPLGSLAKFIPGKGPSEIKRLSQERTIMIFSGVYGKKVSDVMDDVALMLKGIKLEEGYRVKIAGESEEMKRSFKSLQFALILSIVLVYMIMASQFESLSQPLIILFTIPLGLIGVILSLFITGTSINVVALLGVIILGGNAVSNGIILIDYVNKLIERGMTTYEAVIQGSLTRMRPIVMSSLTTILGLLPMAMSKGKGSELRAPMAITILGGLTVATFLTLVVIPAIFLLEKEMRDSAKRHIEKFKEKLAPYVKSLTDTIKARLQH